MLVIVTTKLYGSWKSVAEDVQGCYQGGDKELHRYKVAIMSL
jgi:hypothetical protein